MANSFQGKTLRLKQQIYLFQEGEIILLQCKIKENVSFICGVNKYQARMWVSQKWTVVSVWLHSELKGVKSSSLCACAWVGNDVAVAHCNLWSHLTYGHLPRLKVAENDDSFSFSTRLRSGGVLIWLRARLAWKVIWLLFLMAQETHADVWLDTCMCVIICKSLRGRSHIKADLCAF